MTVEATRAYFRFYAELNDHLPPSRQYQTLEKTFALPGHQAEFNLSLIQPTAVFRRVVHLQAALKVAARFVPAYRLLSMFAPTARRSPR